MIDINIIEKDINELSEKLVNRLIELKLFISTAESCTGGMIASSIVNVPNASLCFCEGIISYSNFAKMKYLGVSNITLSVEGAVSKQTVKEMALGIRKASGSEISVVSSGIAGPGGGTKEKPVGLVYLASSYLDKTFISKYIFEGNRYEVRMQATLEAIKMCLKMLE